MPSYRNPTPPPIFTKPLQTQLPQPTPSLYSNNSIPSPFQNNNIPPQSSTPPTPVEQNSFLTKRWLWVPLMKCSLLHDANPSAVYVIDHIVIDGYSKRFFLRALGDKPTNDLVPDILEHELLTPCEATFRPIYHHPYLSQRPEPSRLPRTCIPSTLSVGAYGQALGIGVSSVQAPLQHNNTGSEFLYSPYGNGSHPQHFRNERHGSGSSNGSGGSRYYGVAHSSSSSSDGHDRNFRRSGGSDLGVRPRERRRSNSQDGARNSDRDREVSGEGGRPDNSRDPYRGRSEDRDDKRKSLRKQGCSGKKEGQGKGKGETRGGSKDKEKSVSKGKRTSTSSRSSSSSSARLSQNQKKKH